MRIPYLFHWNTGSTSGDIFLCVNVDILFWKYYFLTSFNWSFNQDSSSLRQGWLWTISVDVWWWTPGIRDWRWTVWFTHYSVICSTSLLSPRSVTVSLVGVWWGWSSWRVGGGAHGADEVFVVKFVVSLFFRKITMFLTIWPSPVLKLCVMSLT